MVIDIAVPPDGKIIVASQIGPFGSQDFIVVRLNPNGMTDASFGPNSDGTIRTSFNGEDRLNSIALQADGKIVAGGYTNPSGTNYDFALMRITANGSLDTTFDTDGKLTTSIGQYDQLNKVLLQPNGKIFATGSTGNGGLNVDAAVVRYNPNGSLDTSFDGDGIATTNNGASDETTAAALQPDGKIIITERRDFDVSALIRFNTNGSLYTSFHGDGIFKFPASNYSTHFQRRLLFSRMAKS